MMGLTFSILHWTCQTKKNTVAIKATRINLTPKTTLEHPGFYFLEKKIKVCSGNWHRVWGHWCVKSSLTILASGGGRAGGNRVQQPNPLKMTNGQIRPVKVDSLNGTGRGNFFLFLKATAHADIIYRCIYGFFRLGSYIYI